MPPQQRNLIHESDDFELSPVLSKSPVQKRLYFSLSSNEIHPIPHIDDLSDEEVKATWYERSDYDNIKMAMIPIIRKMMKGVTIEETDSQTTRGLEYRTRQGALRRQHNKIEAISAVLDEQDHQIESVGRLNDEILSNVYRQINTHCQEEAHQLALGDVQPAQEHTANALEIVFQQYQNENDHRKALERKSSFGKIMKQMRIRRRSTLKAAATAA
jgi:hypothetical protein